jgi:hypothetical protein
MSSNATWSVASATFARERPRQRRFATNTLLLRLHDEHFMIGKAGSGTWSAMPWSNDSNRAVRAVPCGQGSIGLSAYAKGGESLGPSVHTV